MKTRIKEYRAKYDLTQEDLAKIVGVRRETIVFLEKGRYNPSLMLAYKIAKALNARIEDLFMFEDELQNAVGDSKKYKPTYSDNNKKNAGLNEFFKY
ncbi:MAG: putative transcriptional regulator [Candidatus Woesearchaeota archaeon]|nr:putative transcriptional regulator [Candidatus Woesearchaeota archaeon]MDN5327972.1 putative transcriptional regulator [Candidatus Woesearchaeota archaeon]